ncbi:MAG TPA: SulP family inorganic anion transporter [Candidatus Eisenbacteria bacterium]|nr:SulP family inorganic anion transporter [Candidatus Eisenbacteria bacterium]
MAEANPARVVPSFGPLGWLASYDSAWLAGDLVAGVTLAAYAVPQALAYATLAGLAPVVGVYGYMLGGLGYAALGSSRHLAVGPTSAISLLVGVTVAPMAAGDPERFAQIAALVALVVTGLAVVAWALRLSTLTSFVSDTILLGFKAGAGISIAATQLPSALGVRGGGDNFFARIGMIAQQLGDTNLVVLAVTMTALVLLLTGERLLPGRPVALAVVALSIVATVALGLADRGVTTVGAIPPGLPTIRLPGIRLSDVDGVVPLAAACLLLGYVEGVSAARALASKHGYEVDVRQELLGVGGANLLAALGHGYPVAGGLSQSAVNEKAGAKSPLALVVAAATLALALVFLTDLLRNLPKAVLAAIVFVAVKGLIDAPEIARLRRVSRLEFRVAMIALVGVLLLGVLKGVLVAVVASILLLLHRAAFPHVAMLGRIPNTSRFSDLERNPDNEPTPGILPFRVEASLMYFNIDHVLREVLRHVDAQPQPVRLVVCDLSTSPYVDLAGARMLERLSAELAARGATLRLAEARSTVRDVLRLEGVDATAGPISRRISVADVVAAFQRGDDARQPG